MPHAFLLHLTPSSRLPKHRYLSKYSHGLFYSLLGKIDPALSSEVHLMQRKPFALWASEQKDSSVYLRVSIVDDTLFQPLLGVVLQQSLTGLELGQDSYRVARVLATPEGHVGADYCSWEELFAAEPVNRLGFMFLTPTVFSTSKLGGAKTHYTLFPEPKLILGSLLRAFQHYSPQPYLEAELAGLKQAFEELIVVTSHKTETRAYETGKTRLTGFVGNVNMHYQESAVTVKKVLGQLQNLAFYTGVGAKTLYGMGQVRPRTPKRTFMQKHLSLGRTPKIRKRAKQVLEPISKG